MPLTLDGSAGMTAPQGAVYNGLQTATVASASGTSVDFINLPSWVKRITVITQEISTNGTNNHICQVGSGSFTTSGYSGTGSNIRLSTVASAVITTGFPMATTGIAAGSGYSGILTIVNQTGNFWVSSFVGSDMLGGNSFVGNGILLLSGALDRVRITTVGSTNTFDAGSVNIMYE